MKYLYTLLACIISITAIKAQSDFNEPPTRSEFEQLKSKIQVYERKQNNVLARMNGVNTEIENAFLRLDSVMLQQEEHLDSVITRMALESQGLQEEAVAKFLTSKDLTPIHEEIAKNNKEQAAKSEMIMFGAAGGAGLLLILLIVFLIISGQRVKKLKKEILKIQDENKDENLIALQNTKTDLNTLIENEISKLKSELNQSISKIDINQKEHFSGHDIKLKKSIEEIHNKMDSSKEKIHAAIDDVNNNWKDELESHTKKSETKIKKQSTDFKKLIKEYEKQLESIKETTKTIQTEINNINNTDK